MGRKHVLNKLLRPLGFTAERLATRGQESDLFEAAMRYKKHHVPRRCADLDHVVQRGPFEGLRLPSKGAWADHDLFSKLIGAYEKDLFEALEQEIALTPDVIVNIGASEGYYAIGLQRRLPDALGVTYDIDTASREVLKSCAAKNGVSVSVLEAFDFADPLRDAPKLADAKRPFFVIDCEGCESGLVHMPDEITAKSSFLIELHDLFAPNVTQQLQAHLAATHKVRLITQTSCGMEDFPELSECTTLVGAIMLNDFRYGQMQWIYAVPK